MKKTHITLSAIIIILIIAIATNPSPDKHKEAVENKIRRIIYETINHEIPELAEISGIAVTAGLFISEAIIGGTAKRFVNSKNYLFFSTTQAEWRNNSETIGIGLFGNVFITKLPQKLIEEKINEWREN